MFDLVEKCYHCQSLGLEVKNQQCDNPSLDFQGPEQTNKQTNIHPHLVIGHAFRHPHPFMVSLSL